MIILKNSARDDSNNRLSDNADENERTSMLFRNV